MLHSEDFYRNGLLLQSLAHHSALPICFSGADMKSRITYTGKRWNQLKPHEMYLRLVWLSVALHLGVKFMCKTSSHLLRANFILSSKEV